MAKKESQTKTEEQIDELKQETSETIELLESKDRRISELETELAAYQNHFGNLPAPAKPEPIFKPTCCHKDQGDCRMLQRIDNKNGECLKLRFPVDLKKPETDCEYFRKPL